ncbi:PREDICTED: uncharacterized protein LOC106728034 isoform X1 [Myotis brandtii]|uniref:uncharacterized protein LOC106728034 isoform X1 n=1 Tax=Myotis brandtii TaxID=109478 RepID=UPI0007040F95|nr:PREDICTED: uncharacterized protein LOC106728034 isoform X1 [Myotis brandtii]
MASVSIHGAGSGRQWRRCQLRWAPTRVGPWQDGGAGNQGQLWCVESTGAMQWEGLGFKFEFITDVRIAPQALGMGRLSCLDTAQQEDSFPEHIASWKMDPQTKARLCQQGDRDSDGCSVGNLPFATEFPPRHLSWKAYIHSKFSSNANCSMKPSLQSQTRYGVRVLAQRICKGSYLVFQTPLYSGPALSYLVSP